MKYHVLENAFMRTDIYGKVVGIVGGASGERGLTKRIRKVVEKHEDTHSQG